MKHLHSSLAKNIKHYLKFIPIFLFYRIKRSLNLKKLFTENDFELKKQNFHHSNNIENELIKNLNNIFEKKKNNLERKSKEIDRGKLPENWYPEDKLYQLCLKHAPTKLKHDYIKRYNFHFENIRHDVKKILEIGVYHGRSLKVWKEYFPNAEIYGIDIDPNCKKFEDDRTKIIICDQNDEQQLKKVSENLRDFDIILDDGSHKYLHIIKTFSFLYSCLKQDGYYVVEDIINNYKCLNFFLRYAYGINYFPTDTATVTEPGFSSINIKNLDDIKNTVGINVYRHIIFLKRGFNPEENPFKNITEKQLIY